MEGVTDRQRARRVACVAQRRDGFFNPRGSAADDRFLCAVDVGNDNIFVDRVQNFLDLIDRSLNSSHHSVVVEGAPGHFVAASAYGFQRIFE